MNPKYQLLLGIAKPFLTPENIKKFTDKMTEKALELKDSLESQNKNTDEKVIGVIYAQNKELFVAVTTVDNEEKIIKYHIDLKIEDIIKTIIQNLI